jgi:hypothetical protein
MGLAGVVALPAVALAAAVAVRPGEARPATDPPPSAAGSSPGVSIACHLVHRDQCEPVRAELMGYLGTDRQAVSIDISANSVCLGDPFGLNTPHCPAPDRSYAATVVARLGDGQWLFLNVYSAGSGLGGDGRVGAALSGWRP